MVELGVVSGCKPGRDVPFCHRVVAFKGGLRRGDSGKCSIQCVGRDAFGIVDCVLNGSPGDVDNLQAVGDCLLRFTGR